MSHGRLLPALLTLAAVVGAHAPAQGGKPPIHGITISTHGVGRDWGTPRIDACLDQITQTGANWVSIHPYARIHADGRVGFRSFAAASPPASLRRPITQAHKRGLKIFIKPHLAYWGSPFKWRGEIRFTKTAQWQRFFSSYQRWIVQLAAATADADGFCVGTELDATLGHHAAWQRIIAALRKATPAPLTYAANWTDYQRVPFWKQLDIIGIQAYFPISDQRRAHRRGLEAGWQRQMTELRRYATTQGKNIVFTELGYTRSFNTAIRPWESADDGPAALAYQCLCTEVALAAIAAEPRVEGAFLWKWFPPPRPIGRDFALATKEMRALLRKLWRPPRK